MNRFSAFAIHLGISLVIFIIIGYLILFHWYPDYFFASDGGWQGIRIVAFVDLVLGPVLTLVVFNTAKPKKELRRDLTIIGTIQAVCLTAGVWVVFTERPIAMVYADGLFTSETLDDFAKAGHPNPDLSRFRTASGPVHVSVVLPDDPIERSNVLQSALNQGTLLRNSPPHLEKFSFEHLNPDDAMPYHQLQARDLEVPFLSTFLSTNGGSVEDYWYFRFGTRYGLNLLAVRKEDKQMLFLKLPE